MLGTPTGFFKPSSVTSGRNGLSILEPLVAQRETSRKREERSERRLAMFFITVRVKRVKASCSL